MDACRLASDSTKTLANGVQAKVSTILVIGR